MREWCNCGSSIRASRRDVIAWRGTHRHSKDSDPTPEPDKQGSIADTQLAYRDSGRFDGERFIPDIQMRMGFTPNA